MGCKSSVNIPKTPELNHSSLPKENIEITPQKKVIDYLDKNKLYITQTFSEKNIFPESPHQSPSSIPNTPNPSFSSPPVSP